MTISPTKTCAHRLVLAVASAFGIFSLSGARAQTASPSPAAASAPAGQQGSPAPATTATTETSKTDANGRHLAPPGTFYLLKYVSATTDKGVEGFEPGQEVHLVEAHRQTHTLVVSDGHAQVEVPPSKLTNDIDIARMARQKDEAKQARIAAYIQSEQAAYDKAEQQAAAFTAQDLERHEEAQAADAAAADQAQAEQTPQPVQASIANGYYDQGGYGYGSPYGYLLEVPVYTQRNAQPKALAPAPAPAEDRGVSAPQSGGGGGGRAR